MPVMQSRIKAITERGAPDQSFSSGYGNITYREWCEREMKRMNDKYDSVYIHVYANEDIALVRGK